MTDSHFTCFVKCPTLLTRNVTWLSLLCPQCLEQGWHSGPLISVYPMPQCVLPHAHRKGKGCCGKVEDPVDQSSGGLSRRRAEILNPSTSPRTPDLASTETGPTAIKIKFIFQRTWFLALSGGRAQDIWGPPEPGMGNWVPGTKGNPQTDSPKMTDSVSISWRAQPPGLLYFFFFLRPQRWRLAFQLPPSSLRLCQLGMGASSSLGRPPRSGISPIST